MNSTIEIPAISLSDATTKAVLTPQRNIPLDRLRGFVTALVVAHHAVLAYHPWAPPPSSSLVNAPWRQAFPVIDSQRWSGWALFVGFNDVFFMALMFFLSGVFVWSSLQRKGSGQFLRDRFIRLGLPFIVAAGLLAPLAYYPAYLQSTAGPTLGGYWSEWRALDHWPAGPAWFLWVLLAFGCAAAGLYKLMPGWAETVNTNAAKILSRPARFFFALVFVSAVAYIPMVLKFGPLEWKTWGPFAFQTSRIFLYGVYFAAGIILGAGPLDQTLLSPSGPLARRWLLWPIRAIGAFLVATVITVMSVSNPARAESLAFAGSIMFTVSCAATSLGLLALFLRFAKSRGPLLDNYCAAAYGIYIIHYPIVSWTQFALLRLQLPGFVKGAAATVVALGLSWGLVALGRRVFASKRTGGATLKAAGFQNLN